MGANVLYTRAGAGSQATRLGDRLNFGVSAGYRIWSSGGNDGDHMHLGMRPDGIMHHGGVNHAPNPSAPPSAVDLSLGINTQWTGAQTIAGIKDDNTGGTVVFLTPGIRFTVDKWSSFLSVGIPVAHQLSGYQSEPRLQVTSGVSVKF